jgi:hypothetical protein
MTKRFGYHARTTTRRDRAPDQAVAADRGPETDPNYEFQCTIGEVLRSLAHVDGREASLEKSEQPKR